MRALGVDAERRSSRRFARRARAARRSSPTSTGRWRRSSTDPQDARVPEEAREVLRGSASAIALVACVTGRRALRGAAHGRESTAIALRRQPRPRAPRPGRRRARGCRPTLGRSRRAGARARLVGPGRSTSSRRRACGSRTRARSRRSTGAAPPTPSGRARAAEEIAVGGGEAGPRPALGPPGAGASPDRGRRQGLAPCER